MPLPFMLPFLGAGLGKAAVGATAAGAAGTAAANAPKLMGLFGSPEEEEEFLRSLTPGMRLSSNAPRIFGKSEQGQRSPLRLTETSRGPLF